MNWNDENDVLAHIEDELRMGKITGFDPLRVDVLPNHGRLRIQVNAWRGDKLQIEHNGVLMALDRQETTQGQPYAFYVQRSQFTAEYGDSVKLVSDMHSCLIHCCKPYPLVEYAKMVLEPEMYWNGVLLVDIQREEFEL